jgi:hypothetical protein
MLLQRRFSRPPALPTSAARRLLCLGASSGLLARLEQHAAAGRTAIIEPSGHATSYADLLLGARAVAERISSEPSFARGERVAFLARPGVDYVRTLLGVWRCAQRLPPQASSSAHKPCAMPIVRCGGVAVPLCVTHPEAELQYSITEADACVVAAHGDELAAKVRPPLQICVHSRLRRTCTVAPRMPHRTCKHRHVDPSIRVHSVLRRCGRWPRASGAPSSASKMQQPAVGARPRLLRPRRRRRRRR